MPGGPLPRIGNWEGRSRSTTSDDGAAKAIRRGMATRAASAVRERDGPGGSIRVRSPEVHDLVCEPCLIHATRPFAASVLEAAKGFRRVKRATRAWDSEIRQRWLRSWTDRHGPVEEAGPAPVAARRRIGNRFPPPPLFLHEPGSIPGDSGGHQ